ncbi:MULTISPECIES: TIGR03557 family F420-dependent LLM class oxidoreductase [unclassified Kitasatospora]|uniref:TIGR03557 family F420-dependent LLM class oxidoreductase n=1 Tax=unclassified Kitasatospora TaxID=2633591 RepID=UPI00070F14B5|nr:MULTISPECIES: TIGR03557 family F420-dependent LLM class oxidoreductase [unclassified Kitasatospora]KQV13240.1 LLM class F420-dependent oxidoreductase [Kitasatospora sp. Root107]KRB75312.1 LLM class F420-dependent oxidoreductase [Kitasatospora sp. Root187]
MTSFGYFLSCEEFSPAELLEQARLARQAGFTHLAISDHYHPWNGEQGNSPFVWSVIGALSQLTDLPVTTLVTCPTVRLHPAVTAQAAATSSVLTSGRFRLGVGTGEALNEHILGDAWPPFGVRADMLTEAVEVMRQLFTGEPTSHRGTYYTADNARLYNPPVGELPVYVSGFGPRAAQLAARIGDGFVTVGPEADLVRTFKVAGGEGKPVLGGVKVCWGHDRDQAVRTVHRLWPNELLPGELAQVLPTPRHFEQASELVTEQMVADAVTCGDDVDEHLATLQPFVEARFDEVYVGQIGPDQRGFFDFYGREVLPRLHA